MYLSVLYKDSLRLDLLLSIFLWPKWHVCRNPSLVDAVAIFVLWETLCAISTLSI